MAYAAIMLNFMGILLSLMAMLIIPMDWTWQLFTMDFKPWRLFLISISLLNLWNGIIFAFLPESPKFLLALNQPEKALQVLRQIYAFNTGQSEEVNLAFFLLNCFDFSWKMKWSALFFKKNSIWKNSVYFPFINFNFFSNFIFCSLKTRSIELPR